MTCAGCGHEFCWLCRKKYSNHHYKWWNVAGCPNKLQYSPDTQIPFFERVYEGFNRVFASLGYLLIAIFVIVIIMIMSIFGGIVFGVHIPYIVLRKKKVNPKYISILSGPLAILCFPIIYPIGIFNSFTFVVRNFSITNCQVHDEF